MEYESSEIEALTSTLADVIENNGGALDLIRAAQNLIPFEAAHCIVYRKGQRPLNLADSYPTGAAKEAVKLFAESTYLLNPVYNAILGGLSPGLYLMVDLAPDNWNCVSGSADVLIDEEEEIGYRTPGWPTGMQELVLTADLGQGAMGEISFARPSAEVAFRSNLLDRLRPFLPIYFIAFRRLWERHPETDHGPLDPDRQLKQFARDILSPREAEISQMILKGHSSLSISLTLGIAISTVKTHRKNAYTKLGISTQQQLFNAFINWQSGVA